MGYEVRRVSARNHRMGWCTTHVTIENNKMLERKSWVVEDIRKYGYHVDYPEKAYEVLNATTMSYEGTFKPFA